MKVFCFLNAKDEIPEEAAKLWKGLAITVIGASRFKGVWIHPIIPPSFTKEGGRHTFSLLECHKLEKAGKVIFEEIRKGLWRGVKC